ncbi:MAG: hypothetical protein U9Q74_11140 [Gemmatimonadota bacterium]|nr:hypothetical protein [Gemmatimonadota bacterium]
MTRRFAWPTALLATLASGLAAALGAPDAALAQEPAPPAAMPPVRPLGKVVASSTELLTAVSQVRALPDGKVLVNDNGGRKVVLFDPALSSFTVVADTTSATANAYSSRAGGLIPYKGDSTLFVDPSSLSMLVIDGKGQVTRVMSIPRPQDANALVGGGNGTPAFDAQGRLVYRANPSFQVTRQANAGGGNTPAIVLPQMPDSTALIRIDLATRKVDTVAKLKIPKQNISMTQTPDGRMSVSATINPLQYVDDWAVTSDGRVAVARGQEYRVDWIGADDKVAASSKIPFAWRHLDDSAKTAFLDSTRTALEKVREEAMKRMQQGGAAAAMEAGAAAGAALGGGGVMFRAEVGGRVGGGDAPKPGATNAPQRGGMANIQLPPINLVGASELPDYAPPFAAGSALGDADGNLWIRTTNVYDGGSVYDVVNSEGKLVDRVLLPPGRVIAGFGKGGVVYMGVRVDATGVRLEKATLR